MKRILLMLAALALSGPALAQTSNVRITGADSTGTTRPVPVGTDGRLKVDPGVAQGADAATAAGQLDLCAVVSGDQTYTVGTVQPLNCTVSGRLKVGLSSATNVTPAALPTTTTQASLMACRYLATPPAWSDGWTGAMGCDNAGNLKVAATPTSSSVNAIVPVRTTAVASNIVLKASAGNLYSINIVTGASAGYLMVFDAVAAPADGAVTPVKCLPIAANVGLETNMRSMPEYFATGITAVFSTTGCFTKTASATAFISGDVK